MKKLFLVFIVLVVSFSASAQTDSRLFYAQLMVVFSDIGKNFEYLKGEEVSKQDSLIIYETIRSLEGTKDNIIVSAPDHYEYRAAISDPVSEDGAKLILSSWKNKLNEALAGMFSTATAFNSEKDPGTNGYQYTSEKLIVLLLRHKEEDGTYLINLVIKSK